MQSLNFPYNARIDQIRWLAATIVFLFHYHLASLAGRPGAIDSSWLGIITEGHTGVGLFFTLSGFLFMQIALHQRQIVYRDFVRNRCLRILPLFLAIFLLATSIGRDTFQPQDILYVLASNLGNAPTSGTVVTGAAWCISLEFLFYLLFPFLARFTLERGPRYLVQLLALLMVFKLGAYSVNPNSTLMYFSTFVGRFDQFIIGMLAAHLFARHAPALRRAAPWLLPLALLLALANSACQASIAPFIPKTHHPFWITWSMQESAVWALFIVSWVAFDKRLPPWIDKLLNHGGKISFSFYLLHMLVIQVMWQWLGPIAITGRARIDAALWMVLVYASVWAIASLSYVTIELPFLQLRRRYGKAASPVA